MAGTPIIKLKRSSVAGKAPTTTDLSQGEVAINLVDRVIYTKDHNDNIVTLGGNGPGGDVNLTNATSEGETLISSPTGILKTVSAGTGIELDVDTIPGSIEIGLTTDVAAAVQSVADNKAIVETLAQSVQDDAQSVADAVESIDQTKQHVDQVAASIEGSKEQAATSERLAEEWATKENDPVADGQYSAKHWATVASNAASMYPATETQAGLARFATNQEVIDGVVSDATVSPNTLKPVLDTKLDRNEVGVPGGVAPLDDANKIPAVYLPGFVDEVTEYPSFAELPEQGQSDKIYVTIDTNKVYRWGGSTYVEISAAPGSTDAVPEGVTNLYFTNERAYAASPVKSVAGRTGNVHLSKSDVGLDQVDNTSDLNKPISTATQTALDEKAPIDNPTFTGNVKGITQSMVGLSEVDNTSDLNKPISTATQTALSNKADLDGATFTGKISTVAAGGEGVGLQLTPATTTPPSISLTHGDVWLENNTIKYRGSNNTTYEVSNNVTYDVIGKEELEEGISSEARLISAEAFRHGVLTSPTANPSEAGLMSAADKIKLDSFGDTFPNTTDDLPEGATNLYFTPERVAQVAAVKSVAGKTGEVTLSKSDVELDQVDNTSDLDKPISTATQAALDEKASSENPVFTGVVSGIDKADVGLSNVDNTSDLDKPISTATQDALDEKAPIDSPSFTGNVSGITKGMVGLGNVDNVSDINKPISIATQNALDNKVDISSVGEPGGVVPLDASGKIDISFIPASSGGEIETTDDLPEGATNLYFTPERVAQVAAVKSVAGKTGEVILTKDDVSLDQVDNTSDLDKPISTATQAALDEKVSSNNPVFTGVVSGIDKADVGLSNVDNTSDLDKPISTATQDALDEKASKNHTHAVDDIVGLQNTLNNKLDINGNALTATKLQTPTKITIGSSEREFDGSEVISWSLLEIGAATVNHTHETATASTDGFMSAVDKAKLDQLVSGSGDPLVTSVNGQVGDVILVAGDVGLENVDNTSDINKPISYATQIALDSKAPSTHVGAVGDAHGLATTTESGFMSFQDKLKLDTVSSGAEANLVDSVAGKTGEVILTKDDVGLDQVDNTSDVSKPISDATQAALDGKVDKVPGKQLSTEDFTAEDKTKLIGIESGAQVNTVNSVAGRTGTITLTKTDVGLANVNNTSDANKPISTATQQALDNKSDKTHTHSEATTTTSGFMSSADKSKLDAIAPGATSNSTDAQLRDRATHTGQQPISTITNLQSTLDEKFKVSGGTFSGKVVTSPSTTSTAGLNLSPGQDPIAPTYGDMWIAGDKFRIRGSVDTFDIATTNTWIPISNEEIALGVAVTPRLITAESFRHGYMSAPINTATQTALTNKAPLIHTHTIAEVDGLQAELDNKQTKGSAASSADKLTTAVQIGGVEFDGSRDIDLPGVNVPGNQNTTGSAAKLTTSRNITIGNASNEFDGSIDVTWTLDDMGAAPIAHSHADATVTDSGFMSVDDKVKLDGVESGAQVNTITSVAGRTGAVVLTKADVGLANVDNTSDEEKPISAATQTALDGKAEAAHTHIIGDVTGLQSALDGKLATTGTAAAATKLATARTIGGVEFDGTANINLPGVDIPGNQNTTGSAAKLTTARKISVGNAEVLFDGSTDVSIPLQDVGAAPLEHVHDIATITADGFMSSTDKVKLDGIEVGAQVNTITSVAGRTGAVVLTKADVGLSNVDNTSDLNKPISTATQTALNGKVDSSLIGAANGIVPLDSNSKIASTYLPSFVDEIIEVSSYVDLPTVGESGKIYTTLDTNQIYRWGGTTYVEISPAPGSTDEIAEGTANLYYTDARASAAAPVKSVAGKTGAVVLTKSDVGLSNVDNTSDLNKPISTATQAGLDTKAPLANPTFTGTVKGITKAMVGLANVDNTSDLNKPISTATQTALDEKAEVVHTHTTLDVVGLQAALDNKLEVTGTAVAATKLATARTIGGVAFDGTANINLPGVNAVGNQNTTGSAAKLTTARTLTIGSTGKVFDGSANVTWTLDEIGVAGSVHSHADATVTDSGFMSADDKVKLDDIESGAQVNTVNSVAGKTGVVVLTKADVGLANIDNTSDLNKPISTATQTALNGKANLSGATFTGKINTMSSTLGGAGINVPVGVTPTVPLTGDVWATSSGLHFRQDGVTTTLATTATWSDVSQLEAQAGTSTTSRLWSAQRVRQAIMAAPTATTTVNGLMSAADKTKLDGIAAGAQVNTVNSVAGKTGVVVLTKADVGLDKVDNTSDLNKPVSTATQAALDDKADAATTLAGYGIIDAAPISHVGSTGNAHGVATTTVAGFMSSADKVKLDAIATGANKYVHPTSGVVAGTYNSVTVNDQGHVTGGTNPTTLAGYGIIDAAPISHVGSTGNAHGVATTTIAGFMSSSDKNKLNAIEPGAQVNTITSVAGRTGAVVLTKADVGLDKVDNTSDLNKPISTATQTALDEKAEVVHTHSNATTTVAGFMSSTDKVKLNSVESGAQVNTITSVAGKTGVVTLTKSDVGLSNVDNTSDANKPISTATQTALNGKANLSGANFTGKVVVPTSSTSSAGLNVGIGTAPSTPVAGDMWISGSTLYFRDASTTRAVALSTTWSALTQVEAEAGTSTTARLITAQRLRQGVLASPVATLTTNGLMSSADKTKLDGLDGMLPQTTDDLEEGVTNLYYTDARASAASPVQSVAGRTGVVVLTKADVGLSNVDNTSDAAKPISTATQTALDGKANATHNHTIDDVSGLQSALDGKLATTGTAAAATKLATARTIGGVSFNGTANINLPGVNTTGNQNTTGSAAKLTTARTISIAGVGKSFDGSANIAWTLSEIGAASAAHTHDVATITADGFMSADDKVKLDDIESGAQVNTITSVAGKTGAVVLTKADVGLSNVDNTSDAAKPISTATQTALNGKVNTSLIGAVNGIAPLDSNSKIPSTYLPSFVDDVIEVATYANLPTTGESGKIYTTLDTNQIYRWGGTAYIEISPAPGSTDAVPEGTTNLYYTNARAAAAAPVKSVAGKTGAVVLTKSDVGLANVDNTSDAAKPISTATQTALNLKAPLASPTFTGTVKGITKAMVGLGSVDNTSDLNKPISTATQTALDGKADSVHTHTVVTTTVDGFMSADDKVKLDDIESGAQVNTITSVAGKTGAVVLTKSDVGLANVDNTSDAAKPISTATQTALNLKAPLASPTFTGTVKGITKAMVGLGNVDNTSDLDKPISTATQTALDGKANSSHTHTIANITGLQTALDGKLATTGTAAAATKLATARTIGGVSFDGTTNITLPGVNAVGNQNTTGSAAKLTTARTLTVGSTGKVFDGSANVAWSLAEIGAAATSHTHTNATTTVDGFMSSADKVKLNGIAAGAQVNTITSVAGRTGAVVLTKADVGLANVDNTSDLDKPISTATQTALDGKADLVGASFSGKINTTASTVTEAGLNIAHGVSPTAPVSGDMWTTTSGLYVRLGSTTRTMVHTGTWSTVSQTEAEAGTSTTARLWTAQRVRQSTMAAPVATTTTNGLMALEDKTYLESLKTKHVINSVDDGLNTLQVVGGTRTDTLAVGTVQNADESVDTDGNIKVRGEGQLILGDFAIQYNSTTKSLDFNYIGV